MKAQSLRHSLLELRDSVHSHRFTTGSGLISIARILNKLDTRTREDGFHVLHDWDGKLDKLNDDTIPLNVLDYVTEVIREVPSNKVVLAILLDYYFFYVLAVLSMRVWDEGNVNDNLDRLSALLEDLQGPNGSGQKFVHDAETLVLVATSHFEPDGQAYERLLERIRLFDSPHRMNVALAHAPILSSHLRFGFEVTYGRDILKMRRDNIPDYPWLCFALGTLMHDYANRLDTESERQVVVEALLNALCPDARAFLGTPPDFLDAHEAERVTFKDRFQKHKGKLLNDFARLHPSEQIYSPISFHFNFSHNLLKAIVVDSLLRGKPCTLSLNDLFTGVSDDETRNLSRLQLAKRLMSCARNNPDTINGQQVPVIVYDPDSGRRAFTNTIKKIKDARAAQ